MHVVRGLSTLVLLLNVCKYTYVILAVLKSTQPTLLEANIRNSTDKGKRFHKKQCIVFFLLTNAINSLVKQLHLLLSVSSPGL